MQEVPLLKERVPNEVHIVTGMKSENRGGLIAGLSVVSVLVVLLLAFAFSIWLRRKQLNAGKNTLGGKV